MVAPAKKERHQTKQSEVFAHPFNLPKVEPKRRPATQRGLGNWFYRLVLSGFLFLTWCLINGLIMVETKAYNWQKSQVSVKEMQVRQMQAKIARRLSELSRNSLKPSTTPILLSVDAFESKPTLLGRR